MLKTREAAKILENIVGEENFSEDSAVISSYTFQPFSEVLGFYGNKDETNDKVNLGAVILPGSVDEVQTIIKTCNRYKINFKAFSTGLGAFGLPVKEGSLQIDLRRMNRIIKLDDKNMYAIVEPYVSHLELQAELLKKGLTCHLIGAGSQTSVLASATSLVGSGHSAVTTSYQGRNVLGEEWVTPIGEVVRWGLVEEGKVGYPGPGLRGIYRGRSGAVGSLGIFTKVAVKLYPWPGPAELETTGRNPTLGYKIPDNFRVYMFAFPSPQSLADATYKLVESQIAYHLWYHPLFMHTQRWLGGAKSNNDHYEAWKKVETAGMVDKNLDELTVIIAAYSKKELNFKEKILRDIISETCGEEFLHDFMTKEDMERFFCAQIVVHKPCTEFRSGGGETGGGWSQFFNLDAFMKGRKGVREIFRKYIDQSIISDYGSDTFWAGPEDQKAMGHAEFVSHSDWRNRELVNAHFRLLEETEELAIKENIIGTGLRLMGPKEIIASQSLGNYYEYKRKIKKALDPNNVSDSTLYVVD
jgi:glycolate oxidase